MRFMVLMMVGMGLAGVVRPAAGQRVVPDSAARGEVVGTVLDAASGTPLAGAVVQLEPQPGGAVAPTAVRSPFWSSGVAVTTDWAGGYRFGDIPPGTYRLMVRRLGYQPAVIEVELRRAAPLRVSVGLVVRPILLAPEEVTAPAALFASSRSHADALAGFRLDAELFRQRTFVESDVHVLTHGDVVDAVTLGETDLFRALHRLPGVTTRDDYTAELWTRGAPWSHTRVYFDGMPLFNPLHTAGVFSSVNPDAVGAAFFHPGVRSTALGEGGAGVIDLTSRTGSGSRIGGAAELSVVSGRLAMHGGFGSARGGWMLTGRRSYVDLLTSAFSDSAGRIPYAFLDLTGRTDVPLGAVSTLEVSGMWARDEVRGSVRDILRSNEGHWGNGVARMTLATPIGGLSTRHTIGISRYDARVGLVGFTGSRAEAAAPAFQLSDLAVTHQPTDNAITYVSVRSRFEPTAGSGGWAVGYEVGVEALRYAGPTPRPYPVAFFDETLLLDERRTRAAAWAEHRFAAGPVTVQSGLRVESTGDVANAGPVVFAPRVSARLAPSGRAALTLGASRTYQYSQTIAPAGPGLGPELHLTDVWLTANDTLPALQSDIATLGGETWLGNDWLGSVNLYARHVTGVTVPDPTPGPVDSARPIFAAATSRAIGVEASLRRLAGRWTGSLSYSHGSSRLTVGPVSYPAPTERRHVLDLTGMLRVSPALRVGAAFTAASGAPYTRYFLEALPCDSLAQACPDSLLLNTTRIDEPGTGRAPTHVAVDVLADWSHAFESWSLGVFLQLRNAINRRGAVTYAGSFPDCPVGERDVKIPEPGVCDVFERGLPLLPLVGVSVRF